jgi:hypothetical protein
MTINIFSRQKKSKSEKVPIFSACVVAHTSVLFHPSKATQWKEVNDEMKENCVISPSWWGGAQ